MFRFSLIVLALCAAPAAAETLDGPYRAHVTRVLDGDSFEARVRIWLGQEVVTVVRLAGVDAAELGAPCAAAREQAAAARDFLARRMQGRAVILSGIRRDKFGGRIVARASDAGGDLGAALLAAGLARLYEGRRGDWCASPAVAIGSHEGGEGGGP